MNTVPIQKYCVGKSCCNRCGICNPSHHVRKLQTGECQRQTTRSGTVWPFMPYTDRKCQSDSCLDLYVRLFLHITSCFFPTHSLVLSVSLHLFSHLSLSSAEECASQQYLMKVWLTGRCCVHVSALSCFMCVHADEDCQLGEKEADMVRLDRAFPLGLPTQN